MTWGLPPDSRSTTHVPNAPPGHDPPPPDPAEETEDGAGSDCCTGCETGAGAGALCTRTGAVLACRGVKSETVWAAGGAGGASSAGGAGM